MILQPQQETSTLDDANANHKLVLTAGWSNGRKKCIIEKDEQHVKYSCKNETTREDDSLPIASRDSLKSHLIMHGSFPTTRQKKDQPIISCPLGVGTSSSGRRLESRGRKPSNSYSLLSETRLERLQAIQKTCRSKALKEEMCRLQMKQQKKRMAEELVWLFQSSCGRRS